MWNCRHIAGFTIFSKKNKNRIADLRAYGVTARVDHARVPLNELLAQIDSELQLLSEAHLDRYFKIPT